MVYIAFKELRFQAPTGGGSGMNSPWMLGDYCIQSKMTNVFWRGYHPLLFHKRFC